MTEWSRSGPTRCDEPITAGDTVIWMSVISARGRVIGESYNLPATAVALRPVEAAAPARCTRRRLSVAWVTTRPVPGRLSRFGWGRLAVGGRCLVGGVRQHTVRGRC